MLHEQPGELRSLSDLRFHLRCWPFTRTAGKTFSGLVTEALALRLEERMGGGGAGSKDSRGKSYDNSEFK